MLSCENKFKNMYPLLLGWALDNCSWEPAIPEHMGIGLFVGMACGHFLFVSCSLEEALAGRVGDSSTGQNFTTYADSARVLIQVVEGGVSK